MNALDLSDHIIAQGRALVRAIRITGWQIDALV